MKSCQKYHFKILALLLAMILTISGQLYSQNYRFDRISLEEGLSQSTVYWVTQDKKGFMWFGTQDGLNRYDGYTFKIYKTEPNNENSLSINDIYTIYVDNDDMFWIGTDGGGLNKFDPKTGKFYRFMKDPKDSLSISDDYVRSIKEDGKGNLWIGTFNGGLNKFNKRTEKFTHYRHNKDDSTSISSDKISSMDFDKSGVLWIATNDGGLNKFVPNSNLFEHFKKHTNLKKHICSNNLISVYCDRDNNLWIGTDGDGLDKYSIENNTFSHFKNDYTDSKSLSHNRVRTIIQDDNDDLWFGTEGGGLNKFDIIKEEFTAYRFARGNEYSLSSDHVISIFKDTYGSFWMGTYGGGVSKFTPSQNKFKHYKNEPGNLNSISHNQVDALYQEEHGDLWIGSYGGGISVLNTKTNQFKHFLHDPTKPNGISSNVVRSIMTDTKGNYWIGTYGSGVDKYNPKTGIFSHFPHDENDTTSLSFNKVRSIVRDQIGQLWIATFGGGLNKLIEDNNGKYIFKKMVHEPKNPNSISGDRVMVLMLDKYDNLWIGAFGAGVDVLNKNRDKFYHYRHNPENMNSLSTNNVLCIYQANNGIIWIGTFGGGVNSINRATGEIKRYSTKEGLSNDVVYGILEDEKGRLWMSTNKGLSVLNPETDQFRNYSVKDGLQSDEFNSGAYLKGHDGKMYFGGINGLNSFYPWEVTDNPGLPDVVITGFYVFNKAVKVKDDIESSDLIKLNNQFFVEQDIPYTKEISLSYNENVFSVEFSGLHYTVPEQNRYAYRMENFEKDWNYVSSERRYVTYTNLNPGTYIFHVKASNNDGVWNEEGSQIKIIISPPFWKTIWFYTLIVVIIISSIYLFIRLRLKKLSREKIILIEKVKESTVELVKTNDDLEKANEELEKLSIVASKMDNGVIIADANGKIEWINDGLIKMLGYDLEEYKKVRGENLQDATFSEEFENILEECITEKTSVVYENYMTTKDDKEIWTSTSITPILDEDDNIKKLVLIDTDVTKLKEAQTKLERQNEEKSTMLKEIHHRVKNNLQIVNSLLKMQSYKVEDEKIVRLFEECQSRVISMALLHEKMYESRDLSRIDTSEHFSILAKELIDTYGVKKNIKLDLNIGKLDIGMKTLVPLGLIINEIITNSLKYGFQGLESGVITIHLKNIGGKKYELIIGDNGVGISEDVDWKTIDSLGMELIRTFTEQLNGTIDQFDQSGTVFKILFEKIDRT